MAKSIAAALSERLKAAEREVRCSECDCVIAPGELYAVDDTGEEILCGSCADDEVQNMNSFDIMQALGYQIKRAPEYVEEQTEKVENIEGQIDMFGGEYHP